MSNHKSFIGFENIQDYFHTLFGTKTLAFNLTVSIVTAMTAFITKYIYNDVAAVYLMIIMAGVDFLTGVMCAIQNNSFRSARLPRQFVSIFSYCVLLSFSWNMAEHSKLFSLLPAIIYGGILATLFVSVAENCSKLGIINKNLYQKILDFFKKK